MENIIKIKGLSKRYDNFALNHIDLNVPSGMITGFIGENGAGKTTTIKLLIDAIKKDEGEIQIFGTSNEHLTREMKENISVILEDGCLPEELRFSQIARVMKEIYANWDQKIFDHFIARFGLSNEKEKRIKNYSKGMKVKLSLAIALSHHAKLLIIDESTSGLDPIFRNEILDILLEFIQKEQHAVLISSHILSDLEKICDYIAYIRKGQIVFNERKDELDEKYAILKCSKKEFQEIERAAVIGYRENSFGVEALILRKRFPENFAAEKATIEEIMLYYSIGGAQNERNGH